MEAQTKNSRALLLLIAYLGFISLGLPDTLIGVAWPSVRDAFALDQADAAFIFFGTGTGYFISSFFTGRLLGSLKIGLLLAASSTVVALSGLGYGTAPVWALFAGCSLLHGLGSGAIDAGLNHYVAHHFSARHMNWLHACYSLGAMFGPLVMTGMIAWNGSWRAGYVSVAAMLIALSLLFGATHRRWNNQEETPAGSNATGTRFTMIDALRHVVVWLQIVFFFIYTGLEVTIGQWSFTILTESRQMQSETAGLFVTAYWGSILAGRVVFGFLVDRLGIDRLLRWSLAAAMLATVLLALNISRAFTAVALTVAGLGLAAIYPNMMTRTPQRLGKELAAHAIGFQVGAAMLGAAALPAFSGFLAQRFGLETIAIATVFMAAALIGIHEALLRRKP